MATLTKIQGGTLKSFTPQMNQNNEHKSWNSTQGKKFYDFDAVITRTDDTEDKGTMSSISTEPKWTVGAKIVKYDRSVSDRGDFVKFSKIDFEKAAGSSGSYGGGRKKSKEETAIIIRSVAARVTHQYINEQGKGDAITNIKMILDTADYLDKSIHAIAKGSDGKDITVENALYTSIEALQFKNIIMGKVIDGEGNLTDQDNVGIKNIKEFRDYAIELFRYIWGGFDEYGNLKKLEDI